MYTSVIIGFLSACPYVCQWVCWLMCKVDRSLTCVGESERWFTLYVLLLHPDQLVGFTVQGWTARLAMMDAHVKRHVQP